MALAATEQIRHGFATDSDGRQLVEGGVASNTTDAGNPVKVGAKYVASPAAITSGHRTDLITDSRGNLRVALANGTAVTSVVSPADDLANGQNALATAALLSVYDGSTWDRARSDGTTGGQAVGGSVAHAATDSGNPVKIGGRVLSTSALVTDGHRVDLITNRYGSLKIDWYDRNANVVEFQAPADAASNGDRYLPVRAQGVRYNGSTWDRMRGNEEATLLASAARTTTQTSADITNYNGMTALIVVLDMTNVGTGDVTVTIEGKDSASGKYYTLLAGTNITSNSTNRYRVGPNLAAATNSVAQDYLPRVFRIVVTANNANSATYSVGYNLIRG